MMIVHFCAQIKISDAIAMLPRSKTVHDHSESMIIVAIKILWLMYYIIYFEFESSIVSFTVYHKTNFSSFQISLSVYQAVNEWGCHKSELNALQVAILFSSDLEQTYHQGRVPQDVITYCFRWKYGIFVTAKPQVELLFFSPLTVWKNRFHHMSRKR